MKNYKSMDNNLKYIYYIFSKFNYRLIERNVFYGENPFFDITVNEKFIRTDSDMGIREEIEITKINGFIVNTNRNQTREDLYLL